MASCIPKISDCFVCFKATKYICIACGISVCNVCTVLELDEETRGWLTARSVGYCSVDCAKPPKLHDNVPVAMRFDFIVCIYSYCI